MSWWREALSAGEAIARGAYSVTPMGMSARISKTVYRKISNHVHDEVDVQVTAAGSGTSNKILAAMDWLQTPLSSEVVWEPKSTGAMVDAVLKKAEGKTLRTLEITGHGNKGFQMVGEDVLADGGGSFFDPRLSDLKRVMDKDTVVRLGGCNVGAGENGEALLRGLVLLWGVEVRAAETAQRPAAPGLEGPVLSCEPSKSSADGVSCKRVAHEWLLSL